MLKLNLLHSNRPLKAVAVAMLEAPCFVTKAIVIWINADWLLRSDNIGVAFIVLVIVVAAHIKLILKIRSYNQFMYSGRDK